MCGGESLCWWRVISVEAPPVGMLVGENDLPMVGLVTTYKTAVLLAGPAVPVSADETPPEVLL